MTVFLGTLWSYIKQTEAPQVFDWEHGIALYAIQGNRASSLGEGDVSWVFSSCSGTLDYILELQRGWSFETHVWSMKSGLLSSFEGHFGILH